MQDAPDEDVTRVAVGAIKYSILKSSTNKDITFDFDTSISFEGDSGPYLQYTYARCRSVLRKAGFWKRAILHIKTPKSTDDINDVEKLIYRLPEVVERAAKEYEPHYVANYLNDLASTFNSWYAKEKILDGSDKEYYKLALTSAVAQTLKNGLHILGIEAPEKM
jgi:arginyl-tRNA synthetase